MVFAGTTKQRFQSIPIASAEALKNFHSFEVIMLWPTMVVIVQKRPSTDTTHRLALMFANPVLLIRIITNMKIDVSVTLVIQHLPPPMVLSIVNQFPVRETNMLNGRVKTVSAFAMTWTLILVMMVNAWSVQLGIEKLYFFSKNVALTDTRENVQKWTRVFSTRRWVILVARPRRKKEKKIAFPLLDVFACGQFSSPRLFRLKPS